MQGNIRLDTANLRGFVENGDYEAIYPEIEKAHKFLEKRNGPGADFLGWMELPLAAKKYLDDIEECAAAMRKRSDIIVVIGIGGSYLGAKAAIEMLKIPLGENRVFFAGHNLSGEYLAALAKIIGQKKKDVSVNVISKSGTTTEPAVAFRVIEEVLRKKYGPKELRKRIVCTTDKEKGALRKMAGSGGYRTFVIPDDVGGRFSVLTPVGLLPIACGGISPRDIVSGARKAMELVRDSDLDKNISYKYAAARNILYRKGKRIEVLSNFDGSLHYLAEWWKQLFGESEGKEHRGIYPASCDFTTDLHSMGQLLQEGTRDIFETFIIEEREKDDCKIPFQKENLDNLNYLSGKKVSYVNKQAYLATASAHFEGGVPNATIFLPEKSAYHLGQLFYFFEKAVSISAYVLGVNPFNQPGVESYKKKMFGLLGKPGK